MDEAIRKYMYHLKQLENNRGSDMRVVPKLSIYIICSLLFIQGFAVIPMYTFADGNGKLNTSYVWEGYGGYVAAGNGTWGSTSGMIILQGIPAGATVVAAFIYWICPSSVGLDTFIYVNGNGVTGTQIGKDGKQYGYRSNITALVGGNGIYNITDISPAFGASIVAVYTASSSPLSRVMINDGMDTNNGQPLPHWLTVTEFSGFNTSANPQANVTYIMGDGQIYYQGATRYDKYSFNGIVIANDDADGSDGGGYDHGWDTDTYNVSVHVSAGDTTATANIYEENDELMWVTCVFSVTIALPGPNLPPVAEAGMDQVIFEGDIIQFDGSESYDPDGTIVTYEWDFDASDGLEWDMGGIPDATGQMPKHKYTDENIYTATLRVTDNDGSSSTDSCEITVIKPPVLFINMSADGRDVLLSWNESSLPGIDHYLLYRSTSQVGFNFTDIWINTSADYEIGEPGPNPLRTMWNDTNAAVPNEANFEREYYYTMRAVNILGGLSRTSRTVGKWTKVFGSGISTFSLPLEPLINRDAEWYVYDMKADYLKFMNSTTHSWNKTCSGGSNSYIPELRPGEGYEVQFTNQTNYTFIGFPGAMITYDSDNGFMGFDYITEAITLSISIEPNGEVNLSWKEPMCMKTGDWYEIYYSGSRDGFFGKFGVDYYLLNITSHGTNNTTHVDAQTNDPGTRLYYMIVPFNFTGIRGASSYSVGIWTEGYLPQYDTFGLPLKSFKCQSADWFCDNIPNTVGLNYFNVTNQRWDWHPTRMARGAFDPELEIDEGYQISTHDATLFSFIGI
jgi:hypothetical protein